MLIQKPLSINDIATVRLSSGEEIVGRVIKLSETAVSLTKPVHILARMVASEDGKSVGAQIQFAPFMYSVAETSSFEFEFSHLTLKPIRTNDDVSTSYLAATSSIAVPQTPGLLRS